MATRATDVPSRRLTHPWTSAGHPPSVVVRADGRVELLEEANHVVLGAGLIPGLPARPNATIVLDRDDLLVCCTDGVVERRGENLTEGIVRLGRAALRHASADDSIRCDQILDDTMGASAQDDAVVLTIRVR